MKPHIIITIITIIIISLYDNNKKTKHKLVLFK